MFSRDQIGNEYKYGNPKEKSTFPVVCLMEAVDMFMSDCSTFRFLYNTKIECVIGDFITIV